MVHDIEQGNWLRFGTGKLKELCKQLPEDSEVTTLHPHLLLSLWTNLLTSSWIWSSPTYFFFFLSLRICIFSFRVSHNTDVTSLCARWSSFCHSVVTSLCYLRPTSSWCSWLKFQGESEGGFVSVFTYSTLFLYKTQPLTYNTVLETFSSRILYEHWIEETKRLHF